MNYYMEGSCQIGGLDKIYMDNFGYKTNGSFVEVGAYNGITYSNTYGLALAGWKGLLFEPVPELYNQCVNNYKNIQNVIVKQCCIGDYDGSTTLYFGDSLSTTSAEMVDIYNGLNWSAGRHAGQMESPMFKLDTVLNQYSWNPQFDLLVVDVEGTELEVLKGFNLTFWQPKMAIIEACEKHPDRILARQSSDINKMFFDNNYKKIYCDSINTIFVKNT